jgi:sulfhydrogenase subunit alpha
MAEVEALLARLRAALPEVEALVTWTAALPLPHDEQDFTSVALRHPAEYPMNEGRLVSDRGLDIASADFEQHFVERQEQGSTALYCYLDGQPYLVGPLARLNLNLERLPAAVRAVLDRTGIRFPSRNMFHSIVARAVEMLVAVHEAIRLLAEYQLPAQSYRQVTACSGTAFGCTEAPRGLLWHRYELNADGSVQRARIVPPTSQNQARIEQDLHQSLTAYGLAHSDAELKLRGETVIRNYDPCISCATHFLDLRRERRP